MVLCSALTFPRLRLAGPRAPALTGTDRTLRAGPGLAAAALVLALSGCVDAAEGEGQGDPQGAARSEAANEAPALPPSRSTAGPPRMAQAESQTVTLTGTRVSMGNAVDCPEIRTDDGKLHPVKGLTAEVALGDRITVTGEYGVATTCRGQVLIIAELIRL